MGLNARFTIAIPDDLNDRIDRMATEKGISKAMMVSVLLKERVEGESEIDTIKRRLDVLETKVQKMEKKMK